VIENRLGGSAPYYDAYECADGKWLSLGCFDPHFWSNLCRLLDMPQFTTVQHDPAQRENIRKALTEKFRQRTRDEWTELFIDKEICIAPMLGLDEALEHPQYRARNMVEELVDPKVGRVSQVGSGIKMSDMPARTKTTGPSVGQHTEEVLKSLGYDASGIAGLRSEGAVA
jgi:crotonobetainyl-CoA:carnitine CoA-transferase CaiB-like acyl-CoA transferase